MLTFITGDRVNMNHLKPWLALIWCLPYICVIERKQLGSFDQMQANSFSKSLRDQYSLRCESLFNHFRLLTHSSMFLWVIEYLWALKGLSGLCKVSSGLSSVLVDTLKCFLLLQDPSGLFGILMSSLKIGAFWFFELHL